MIREKYERIWRIQCGVIILPVVPKLKNDYMCIVNVMRGNNSSNNLIIL